MKKTFKLIAMSLAVVTAIATAPTTASAGFGGPFFFPKFVPHVKHFKHFKHFKHHKMKVVKGHHHGGGHAAVVWSIIGCAAGTVTAALAANYRDHRELTADEAMSCGLLFLFSTPGNR